MMVANRAVDYIQGDVNERDYIIKNCFVKGEMSDVGELLLDQIY